MSYDGYEWLTIEVDGQRVRISRCRGQCRLEWEPGEGLSMKLPGSGGPRTIEAARRAVRALLAGGTIGEAFKAAHDGRARP